MFVVLKEKEKYIKLLMERINELEVQSNICDNFRKCLRSKNFELMFEIRNLKNDIQLKETEIDRLKSEYEALYFRYEIEYYRAQRKVKVKV